MTSGSSPQEFAELRAEATSLLGELLRIDTSNPPGGETPAAELLAEYLAGHGIECELVAREPRRANLIARLPGRDPGAPSLMLHGHTDVVPADAERWTHPPFAGVVDDEGWIWGRGALDMKNEVATRAVAMAEIARSGETLSGDLLFVAVCDEEDGTNDVGLSWLVRERPDIATDYVINEGAAERLQLADGRTVVTITVGEKAAAAVRVTALGTSGHSSAPEGIDHAVVVLAELIRRLTTYRPRRRLLPSTEMLLERLLGHGTAADGDLDAMLQRATALHPALASLIGPLFSTTIAPTRLHGSPALNVLPGRASVDCDCRVLPGTTVEELLEELTDALGSDVAYELELLDAPLGGTVSTVESPLYEACGEFLRRHDPEAILLPILCSGFTDSHYMREAFGSVAYGLWPSRSTPHEIWTTTVHSEDERVHTDDLGYATAFHIELCHALLR
jgi:acetylornithine deacetylase/succinyl-diaminopimelate desuccinylase-like protein